MSSKVLLAIEAMSHVAEMADAAAAHGLRKGCSTTRDVGEATSKTSSA